MKRIHLIVAAAILAVPLALWAQHNPRADRNMKAYPAAEEGQTRYVLKLPELADESLCRIELIVGKTVSVDPVNRFFFAGKIEARNIQGWGFTRYVVDKLGPMAGTRMGVPPGTPNVDRFITLGGQPELIRYNSKLPVVVYVPDGAEVRYRLWKADAQATAMPKG